MWNHSASLLNGACGHSSVIGMDAKEPSNDIKDHGTIFKRSTRRIRCNYCRKLISGFRRLKFHLGGVRGDGRTCSEVPAKVKELYQNEVYERNRCASLKKEVISLGPLEELPLKRNCSQRSNGFKKPRHENGSLIDFIELKLLNFQEIMCLTTGNSRPESKSYYDLKGPVLQSEVREMLDYVKRIKQSWSSTGCSILLDTWRDEQGRELVMFLANCLLGPVYIQSYDVSAIINDVDALMLMLTKIIGEVGAENFIQVVVCSTAGWLGAVEKQFVDKCRTGFWSVGASHCISLMLEKVGSMESVKPILEKATSLTKFMSEHSFGRLDLIDLSFEGKSPAIPFMALEDIIAEKEKVEAMVKSIEWEASVWVSTEEGKRVCEVVWDPSFWNEVRIILKVSQPLVRLLAMIHAANEPLVGYIYEAVDQVKESIKKEFKERKSQYMPFWKIIDEIWDKYLHTPLHAAGYYLNPRLFYSSNFYMDTEVAFGLLCCIVRLVQDQKTQDLISLQLDEYRLAKGGFGEGSYDECREMTPIEWWSKYGGECPELQKFAICILSQACEGPWRYKLNRDMAQKLLPTDTNSVDQQEQVHLQDLAFVRYNMQLQQFKKQGSDAERDLP